ncbi:hypothetical protein I4F81_005452 [Pyropia yezoensis]|uniref:Uncharacterized protein n=1 Tax=Pyropia yezoensis TaxID=2788 RepID=A0ACC3BYE2_PYRYE|nr:hypothetical protein I4F81_005452 [Neopyropia yezoensis]
MRSGRRGREGGAEEGKAARGRGRGGISGDEGPPADRNGGEWRRHRPTALPLPLAPLIPPHRTSGLPPHAPRPPRSSSHRPRPTRPPPPPPPTALTPAHHPTP